MSNNNASAATAALLEGLRQHAQGLLYQSETDAPFEVVHFPAVSESGAPAATELAAWAGKPAQEKVETDTLPHFFRNMTREILGEEEGVMQNAPRFKQLQEFLELHLHDVKVYRVGHRNITAFILGRTQAGDMAGLKTTLVET
ncbi:nuclease A inhibitor family protein [Pontibacter sp. 172403-2]|uniref:nuclease A inhibitor family protein n=1 Tax=Pontibacter rufus TaxID=2791028 RepID=UPI0018AF9770|nr:nuclease A inhibitor family protein [Pontibacter sp. 172403-2]MBF9254036.1 nuclease A inhibitor family protein [Pontibacter sp. 172403-2]